MHAYWYNNHEMHVRWGSTPTTSFHVSNGDESGILCPRPIYVYIYQLSLKLNGSVLETIKLIVTLCLAMTCVCWNEISVKHL